MSSNVKISSKAEDVKYYILRTDRPGKIVPSNYFKSKLQTLSEKCINSEGCFFARKGDLFKSMPSEDQPDDDYKIKVMSVDNSSKILEAETGDLIEIQKDAADLLLPVANSDKRYSLFSKRHFVSEALTRKAGERVIMKHEGAPRFGKIKRIGPIKEKDGLYFVIELENDNQLPIITRRKASQGKGIDVTVAVDELTFLPTTKVSQNGVSKSVDSGTRTSQKIEKYDCYGEIKIGTRAAVFRDKKPLKGTIKFIGRLASHKEMTFGIELDTPDGNTSGIWRGERVMKCERNCGLFVKADEMITEEENFEIIGLDGSCESENLEEKMDIDVSDAKVVKQRSTSDKVLSMAKKHLPPNDAHVARSSSTSNVAYHSVNGIHHTSSKLSERAGVSTYLPMDHNHFAADRQRNSTPENYHPISVKLPKRGSENALSNMSSEVNHFKTEDPKLGNYDPSLQIDSLVQISINGAPKYGLIKWIGSIEDMYPNEPIAGLELEEPSSNMGDGMFQNKRYFTAPPGRAIFVKLSTCKKDERFKTSVSPSALPMNQSVKERKGNFLPPIKFENSIVGRMRGIQGHHNSCYLDATLFSMFAFSMVFDSVLYRKKRETDREEYEPVQSALKNAIVNPLRVDGFVNAASVLKLRGWLDKVANVPGFMNEEKDPEEFLMLLLKDVLKVDPFLKIRTNNDVLDESYFYQILVDREEHNPLPTLQYLFELSFLTGSFSLEEILDLHDLWSIGSGKTEADTENIFSAITACDEKALRKFINGKVPSVLVVQLPRSGLQKMYKRIRINPTLDVSNVMSYASTSCFVCENAAEYNCKECRFSFGWERPFVYFCGSCKDLFHQNSARLSHKVEKVNKRRRPEGLQECNDIKDLELFAVVCIQTSHYVTFAKCGEVPDDKWVFFDSMADRIGEENGHNVPEIVECPEIKEWFNKSPLHFTESDTKNTPEKVLRLFEDASLCFYKSNGLSMYR